MCLAIPAKIISIDGDTARTSIGGSFVDANLSFIDKANIGDYVLVHAGFAIEKIDEEEARETLKIFQELDEVNQEQKDEREE